MFTIVVDKQMTIKDGYLHAVIQVWLPATPEGDILQPFINPEYLVFSRPLAPSVGWKTEDDDNGHWRILENSKKLKMSPEHVKVGVTWLEEQQTAAVSTINAVLQNYITVNSSICNLELGKLQVTLPLPTS